MIEIKQKIQQALANAAQKLLAEKGLTHHPSYALERCRHANHGDFSSNIGFLLAKPLGQAPRHIANAIVTQLSPALDEVVSHIEVAGAGFINFRLQPTLLNEIIPQILQQKQQFGHQAAGKSGKLHIEIVSANPTGPLHVGHGRLAAYGASLANLLQAGGFLVHREYYVNDAGRQMNILAVSLWLRYLQLTEPRIKLPLASYQGDYIRDIAKKLKAKHGERFCHDYQAMQTLLANDNADLQDQQIDQLIAYAKQQLGNEYALLFQTGLNAILQDIKDDLSGFHVHIDQWFSEQTLSDQHVQACLDQLAEKKLLYQKEGARWFRASQFGDEKDRVVIRDNGEFTYFATDMAYHLAKYQGGFEHIIDIYGADHHGYVPRMRAFIEAIGQDVSRFSAQLIQFVALYRGNEKIAMSTRKGQFITLRQLREEVGNDAARYFYVMRRHEQHLDFDLALAKQRSHDNPVYYIQYAHARIASVLAQAKKGAPIESATTEDLKQLTSPHEINLLRQLAHFPEVIQQCCTQFEPALMANYLLACAADFHRYYNAETFLLSDNPCLKKARLALIGAVAHVLANGLTLLDISAPQSM